MRYKKLISKLNKIAEDKQLSVVCISRDRVLNQQSEIRRNYLDGKYYIADYIAYLD